MRKTSLAASQPLEFLNHLRRVLGGPHDLDRPRFMELHLRWRELAEALFHFDERESIVPADHRVRGAVAERGQVSPFDALGANKRSNDSVLGINLAARSQCWPFPAS